MISAFVAALLGVMAAQASPGPNMMAVAGAALKQGRRASLLVVSGIATGSLIWAAATAFGLGGVAFATAVIFAALPTASSAYILAMRMGGDGPGVAWLISATTVAAALTLTGWLAVLTRWGPG